MQSRCRVSTGGFLLAVLTVALGAVSAAQNAPRPVPSPAPSPPPTVPPVLVSGRVVDDQNGAPVVNARVTTNVTVVGAPVVLSDQDGQFSLRLPPGLHDLSVNKTGYAKREAAVPSGGGLIEVRLTRGASISGRVFDERGAPAVGFRIRLETRGPNGKRTVVSNTTTDDHGEYRVGGLAADAYFVSFVPGFETRSVSRGPTGPVFQAGLGDAGMTEPFFYPGVTNVEEARPISLAAGAERTDVDLPLPSIDSMSDLLDQQRVQVMQSRLSQRSSLSGLPVPRTAVVRGRVLDRDGHPLSGARVRLIFGGGLSSITSTDKDGVYEFRELAAGTTRVAVTKIGYFPNALEYGGRVQATPSFALKDGETRDDMEVRLDKWAAVEGRVVDERGDPMANAVVQLLQIKYEAGRRSLVRVDIRDPRTDDRGRFRMYAVPSGQFIVSAVVNDVSTAELPGYARGYYPGTPDASAAQYVPVPMGAEVGGIEIALERMRTARIAGKIFDANGRPTGGVTLLLYPRGSAYGEPVGARIERDGTFEFLNVAPGQYVIQAGIGPSADGAFAALPVAVADADIAGLIVQPDPSSRVAGRITFDTADRSHLPATRSLDITAYPVDPLMAPWNHPARATINGDWTFEMSGITGTRRLQLVGVPPGWMLESVHVDGTDVTDRPLAFGGPERSLHDVEVTLTDRLATLTGRVVDDRSRPSGGVPVIAYSTETTKWYPSSRFFQMVTTDASGTFTIKGLPSGTYNVVAVSRLPSEGDDAWQDPASLDSLAPRATKVPVTEGLPATVQPLRIVPR